MCFTMKKREKSLIQLVVTLLLLYTIGLPIQNVVLATEQVTHESAVTEDTETEGVTTEKNTSNSESKESEIVSNSREAEVIQTNTKINPFETRSEERGALTDASKVNHSEKMEISEETSLTTSQRKERSFIKAVTPNLFPNGSSATWGFDDATGTLTISGGTLINPAKSIQDLTQIPVSKITNIVLEDKVIVSGSCDKLFYQSIATNLDLRNLDTSNVTDMNQMFAGSATTSLDLSSFDTSNVTNMEYMFWSSAATSLDVSNFDTSNVTNMLGMFQSSAATSLDLSNFDTSNVTTMQSMFAGSVATSLDLSKFDTSKVLIMYAMFSGSAARSLNLSSFDTTSVTNMLDMFSGAQQLQNITLGNQFLFLSANAALPDPTSTAKYTGKWQNVGNGTVNRPKGSFVGTAAELMSAYSGSTMADTYVWQPTALDVDVQDSVLIVGDTWKPEDNFISATDNAGAPVDFNAITVTGLVDTTQPGVYTVTYSYGGTTSTATIIVLETMPASWINFFVDGTNVRSIPGTVLSTPKWDLMTGLWTGWSPGIVKVQADKLPSEPTKQGYEFKGWKDTTGAIVDFSTLNLDLNSQHEFDFYAAFEKKEYSVTFDIDGKKETQNVLFDGRIKEPMVPKKAGYKFVGWYTSKQANAIKWDFSKMGMPANYLTLYAKFTKLPDSDSGSEAVGSEKPSRPVPPEQPLTSDSDSNTGGTTITNQENATTSPEALEQSKLAKFGEQNSILLQIFGLLMVISGIAFFWWKRKNVHS
ncbi:BspA family leucine-rich repeat surface protein [Listeria monocytogenes]|nr:BspA family leucine-rich repeat surface protein [Listeria monocytogenes]